MAIRSMVLSASPSAEAQEVPALQEGTRVWVTTVDGREEEGSVASMSPNHLVLQVDAASRAIALADVRRIEGRDSLVNGIRNGFDHPEPPEEDISIPPVDTTIQPRAGL